MRGKATMRVAVVCAMVVGILTPVRAHAESARVGLGVCDMMVTATLDEGARLQRFLPEGYHTGRNLYTAGRRDLGVLMYWVFDCDAIQVPGRAVERARISFTTISIETPERPGDPTITPRNFDLYTVFTHTDNTAVAEWLSDGGIPAEVVSRIKIHRSDAVVIQVPGERGYTMTAYPRHPDVVGRVHDHNNTFTHDDEAGTVGLIRATIFNATDTACYVSPVCGHIEALPGTPAAEVLGGDVRTADGVFDHVDLAEAGFSVTRKER